jgi:hypothetical protein
VLRKGFPALNLKRRFTMENYKFVPVESKIGKILSEGYEIEEGSLFPINKYEFLDLKEVEDLQIEWNDLPSEEPKGNNVAYCYSDDQVIMMSKEDYFKEMNF